MLTRPALAALLFTLAPLAVAAAESVRSAEGPECSAIIVRLVATSGAKFNRYSGQNVFFDHPLSSSMVLLCDNPELAGVSISLESAFPSNQWFSLAGKIGEAVTGVAAKSIEGAVRKCHSEALKSKTELADVQLKRAAVGCQAFTRDGGGITMTISKMDS